MKHTPGPWRSEKYCVWAGDKYIAGTQTGIGEPQEANARLIAAAPELHEWLKVATEWMEWWLGEDYCDCEEGHHTCGKHERDKELKLMQAAIAKAEGRA